MHRAVAFRVANDDAGFENHDVFRVANFMGFAAGEPEDERFERATIQPFSDVFWAHTPKFTTLENE